MLQIDKYVAVPPRPRVGNPRGREAKYPWRHMKPGDSFFVAGAKVARTDKRPGTGVQINPYTATKMVPGSEWTARAVTENGVVGARVWRVK